MCGELNKPFIYLAVYRAPFEYPKISLCRERREYLQNPRTGDAIDSRWIWRLLSKEFYEVLVTNLNSLHPHRLDTGKWVVDNYFISLSHSGGLFAVAISSHNIGVDIQKDRNGARVSNDSTWAEGEKEIIKDLKPLYRIWGLWTRKEALYKFIDPGIEYCDDTHSKFDTSKYNRFFRTWEYDVFYFSICSDLINKGEDYSFDFRTNLEEDQIKEIVYCQ